jgi:hypothetical protein
MTVEQVLNMFEPRRLCIVQNLVLVNTWDEEEAQYWSAHGANVRDFYSQQGVKFLGKAKPGWEISLVGACEPIVVTRLTGEVEDKTRDAIVNEARRRRQQVGA